MSELSSDCRLLLQEAAFRCLRSPLQASPQKHRTLTMTTRDLLCVRVCVCSLVPSPFLDSTLYFRAILLLDSQRRGDMWLRSEVRAVEGGPPGSCFYSTPQWPLPHQWLSYGAAHRTNVSFLCSCLSLELQTRQPFYMLLPYFITLYNWCVPFLQNTDFKKPFLGIFF